MKIGMLGLKGIPAAYGGVERHVEELATRLVEKGHSVTVFNRMHCCESLREYKGVRLTRLPCVQQKHLEMASHTMIASIVSLFEDFDILHFHSVEPALFSLISRFRANVVSTSHGQAYRREKWDRLTKWLSKKTEWVFMQNSDARISVSKTLKSYYETRYQRPVVHIPNGVIRRPPVKNGALGKFGLEPGEYILFSGRLEPTKGCHTALEAHLRAKRPEKFVVMGGSTYTDGYVEKLKRYASDKVVFIGHQNGDDMWEVMQNAKLFVFPSEIEGLSIVLLEALCHGLPVIYSDIPENCEVADGVAVPFKTNDIQDLADKMNEVLDDPSLRDRLCGKAMRHIDRFYNWEKITGEVERVYTSVEQRQPVFSLNL